MIKNKSFTLIELLVVIVIIGILAGVIIVSTSSSISKANIAKVKVFENSIQNELGANMVSRWKLDEIVGTNTTPDAWGTNTGTLGDGVTASTYPILKGESECVTGKCMYFDGGDYIIANNLVKNKITVSVWAKATGDGTYPNDTIIKVGTSSGLRMYRTHVNSVQTWFSSSDGAIYTTTNSMPLNTWTHITFTHDGTSARFYVNGSFIGSPVLNNLLEILGNIYIGTHNDLNYSFKGYIDDVRIYNGAISSSQIKQNYIAGLNSLLANNNISNEEYLSRIENLSLND